jgi:hypothetical protein
MPGLDPGIQLQGRRWLQSGLPGQARQVNRHAAQLEYLTDTDLEAGIDQGTGGNQDEAGFSAASISQGVQGRWRFSQKHCSGGAIRVLGVF